MASLAPNATTPLIKRPTGTFDIIATAPGTKTWQGLWMGNSESMSQPGYWAFVVLDLPAHKSEVSLMKFGSKF